VRNAFSITGGVRIHGNPFEKYDICPKKQADFQK
jgi:hypothetical protein